MDNGMAILYPEVSSFHPSGGYFFGGGYSISRHRR